MTDDHDRSIIHTHSISSFESEDKNIQENMLGRKDRPHSRDNAAIGPPKHDNRKKRIDQEDPDIKPPVEADPDMSLNYKYSAKLPKYIKPILSKLELKMNKISPAFTKGFRRKYVEILGQARTDAEEAGVMIVEASETFDESFERFKNVFAVSGNISEVIPEAWAKIKNFYGRAGIVSALKDVAMRIDLPKSIKIPIMSGPWGEIVDPEAIKALLDLEKDVPDITNEEIDRFVILATAYKILQDNPNKITSSQFTDTKVSKAIKKQISAIRDLNLITSEWMKIFGGLKVDEDRVDLSTGDWKGALKKINSFLSRPKVPLVDPSKYMTAIAEQIKEKHGKIPDEIQAFLKGYNAPLDGPKDKTNEEPIRKQEKDLREKVKREKEFEKKIISDEFIDEVLTKLDEQLAKPKTRSQRGFLETDRTETASASYELVCRRMINRLSTYHGIVNQGHPTDSSDSSLPNYGKRYLGKEHFDSILASAKKFLNEDWLKHGWGENPGDAPIRAALDLAISCADECRYQSKIDTPVYNMLLNQLAGWDYDTFNETVFTSPKTRRTVAMSNNSAVHAILKIADDLRETHPHESIQIVKNLHRLMRCADDKDNPKVDQGESFRAQEERKIVEKMVEESAKKFNKTLDPSHKKEVVDKVLDILDQMERERINLPKTKTSSIDSRSLSIVIRMAHEIPEYRKFFPYILAAAKKLKDAKKGKKDEKEKKEPVAKKVQKPLVPEKKSKEPSKKKPLKKKASFDVDW